MQSCALHEISADGLYGVLERLGAGGMGTVYRVRQHPLERMAVLG